MRAATWYVGLGPDVWPARAGWRQLVEGHSGHPPLVELIPRVAELLRRADDGT